MVIWVLWPRIDRRQWEKFDIIALVEPCTFENLDRQARATGQGQGIDGQLRHRMLLLPCFEFVVVDMEKAVVQLQKVNVAGGGQQY
jgi:hypothetical protein